MKSHAAVLPLTLAIASGLNAQTTLDVAAVHPGTPWARYVRVLGVAGLATSRALVAPLLGDIPPDSTGPWRLTTTRTAWSPLPVAAWISYNPTFPYGGDDGPAWQGRGFNAGVTGGVALRWGGFTLVAAPVLALAQNESFPLWSNGRRGDTAFGDPRVPLSIDRPQRFGSSAYTVVDPGASALRVDLGPMALGLTTVNEVWGPGSSYPLLLGTNAAGLPRAFVETNRALPVGIGSLRMRVIWSRLTQSPVAVVSGPRARRLGTGFVVSLAPRGLTGLELGAARFFHEPWPAGGLRARQLGRPFGSVFKNSVTPDSVPENQLASVFARWAWPESGVEVFGEFGREDHSWDLNDFLQEPDHSAAWAVGFRKVWRRSSGGLVSLLAEWVDAQQSRLHLDRPQTVWYTHTGVRQGHTLRGQVLGADAVFGGAGQAVTVEVFGRGHYWTLFASRELRYRQGTYLNTLTYNPRGLDVQLAVGGEVHVFHGPLVLGAGMTLVANLNRYFAGDEFNLQAVARLTWLPGVAQNERRVNFPPP